MVFLPYGTIYRESPMAQIKEIKLPFGRVTNSNDLGKLVRAFRVSQQLTLERVSGMTHIGMRFLSELERGKETVQLEKVLQIINQLGLEMVIQPRGSSQAIPKIFSKKDDK